MDLNQKELASVLGLSTRRVRDLEERGIFSRNESGKYDLKNSVQGYLNFKIELSKGDPGLTAERTRLVKAQADRKELELKKARGDLLDTSKAMQLWGTVCQNMRSKLLIMPTKLAPILFAVKNMDQIRERLGRAVHEALNELANPNLRDVIKLLEQKNQSQAGHYEEKKGKAKWEKNSRKKKKKPLGTR